VPAPPARSSSYDASCVDLAAVAVRMLPQSAWHSSPPCDPDDSDYEGDAGAQAAGGPACTPPSPISRAACVMHHRHHRFLPGDILCAEVVGIVKRGWHPIAATLQPDVVSPLWVIAVPVDTRLPKVRLQTQQEQQLKGKTIVVALDSWDATSRYPTGHYVRTLGETGDKNVEAEALCIDFEVDTRAFSQKVINCLPPKTWVVRPPRLLTRTAFLF
jgi:exosome complex exonuclease DIS3/RRP44